VPALLHSSGADTAAKEAPVPLAQPAARQPQQSGEKQPQLQSAVQAEQLPLPPAAQSGSFPGTILDSQAPGSMRGQLAELAAAAPACPQLCLYSETDVLIPPSDIQAFAAAQVGVCVGSLCRSSALCSMHRCGKLLARVHSYTLHILFQLLFSGLHLRHNEETW